MVKQSIIVFCLKDNYNTKKENKDNLGNKRKKTQNFRVES